MIINLSTRAISDCVFDRRTVKKEPITKNNLVLLEYFSNSRNQTTS